MSYPKRLIEVDLPIRRISEHARREKSIRHGHISTLHIWWARRPLAACRAVICAALWPDPEDALCPQAFRDVASKVLVDFADKVRTEKTLQALCQPSWRHWNRTTASTLKADNPGCWGELRYRLLDFIAEFANWDSSTNPDFLEAARTLTQAAHEALGGTPGTRPLVVDPFAGGGSIPLEALRVGADAFASDLNPVAVLLNKVVLEYIPKYGQRLADEVRKWGAWIKAEAEKELAEFYPKDPDGATPIAYLWARTILSESPSPDNIPIEIPLLRSMWLSQKQGRKFALRWGRDLNGSVKTEIIERIYSNGATYQVRVPILEVFTPSKDTEVEPGTSKGGSATCPISGYTMSVERVRTQLYERFGGALDARLICVVTVNDFIGKTYRIANNWDLEFISKATLKLKSYQSQGDPKGWVPSGKLNHLRGFFNIVLYGMSSWGNIFAQRQLISLNTLIDLVQKCFLLVSEQTQDSSFSNALLVCLCITVDRLADSLSSLTRWQSSRETNSNTFGRQALPMVWDYIETLPLSGYAGSWGNAIDWVVSVIEANSCLDHPGQVENISATNHSLPDDFAQVTFTDPPYYSAIPYADLSDFFYSWLKKSLGNVFSDLFSSDLSPKADECVSLSHRAAMYRHKDTAWFESMMFKACSETRRITHPLGTGVFVFANKETSGWEAMLMALIQSGWTITASWPIDTEMASRLRAANSAALASSVHLVCRPRENPDGSLIETIGDWRDVLQELPRRINAWLPRLAHEGVVGADAIFACLGPALEIFSRYSRVERANGDQVTLREYLEHVWAAVSREALTLVFAGADTSGFEEDARLTAMWLWTLNSGAQGLGLGAEGLELEAEEVESDEEESGKTVKLSGFTLEYDTARKIAQGLGAHLERLTTLVEVKGNKARLLPVAERTKALFGKDEATAPTKAKKKQPQRSFFEELESVETTDGGWGDKNAPKLGETVLDRIHQSMILFAAGRSEALKTFLVVEGAGDERFWRLAQALSALYPSGTDEKRWVDGVLARKKGLGF